MRRKLAQQIIKSRGRTPQRNHNSLKTSRAFLDLPTEIRLLIYEAIFTPASVVLQSGELPAMIAVLQNFPELISRGSRDVQLFRTCRTCYEEASPIFYASLNLLVYQHLPLLRLNFLPRIGPLNASFIRMVTITPIGLPGEHQRVLECLGSKHGGLIGVKNLTLEIWDPQHVPAFISTCQELMQRHGKLKILFGRGTDSDCQIQAGDIPATLKLAKPGQSPGYRVSLHLTTAQSLLPLPFRHFPTLTICTGTNYPINRCHRADRLSEPSTACGRVFWTRVLPRKKLAESQPGRSATQENHMVTI